MNTPVASPAGTLATASRATRPASRFGLLLRREFWEHKGGFLWAPVWAGGISLLLTLMALVVGEVAARRSGKFSVNGLDLTEVTRNMSPEDVAKVADGLNLSLGTAMMWPMIVLGFVVFFYSLGCLYDERKDRSVLFWKSLPVSDRETVFSKLASAVLVAPAVATAVGAACMVALLLMLSVFLLMHGGGGVLGLLWRPGNLLANAGLLLAAIPVYALWALPTVGWLMLCSAWARSKPFLWAIMLPVFAGIFVSWFDIMGLFALDSGWFWKNVVGRLLGGVFPGSWIFESGDSGLHVGTGMPGHLDLLKAMYTLLANPKLWIGVAAGLAMVFGAIRLRRWRDEG